MKRTIAGGSGGTAGLAATLAHAGAPSPRRLTRWLESERLLATLLLAPTILLLGLFIAYPFVMGVWLSLSSVSVGNPGEFVGLKNFVKAWNDSIFRTAFYNTTFYTLRGMPFFAITLLAGLQTISTDLQEAALLDGANGWHRFWHVTWPLLKPVTVVVVVFSIIQTFSDFQLIYVLTGGGPANATHLLATYAYQIGIATGLLGEGAAISLFMLPVLFIVVWVQLRYLRRLEGA